MSRTPAADVDRHLAALVLDDLVGAALVLDHGLRVRYATPSAEAALGSSLPVGTSAATLLCGDRPKRPFAEALAEGVPFQAVIPHPGGGDAQVRVRSVPVVAEAGAASQSQISQFLGKMREEGLVKYRREAQTIYYQINSAEAKKLVHALYDIYCAKY